MRENCVMQTRKTAVALALPALLLAGCSLADVQAAVLPAENTVTQKSRNH